MEEEIQEYVLSMGNLLNGQIRGALNKEARTQNLELIMMTVNSVFEQGFKYGQASEKGGKALQQLKKDLGLSKDNPNIKVLSEFCKKISDQEDCPEEFKEIVKNEFWNLI